jgi:hypothetical protein
MRQTALPRDFSITTSGHVAAIGFGRDQPSRKSPFFWWTMPSAFDL